LRAPVWRVGLGADADVRITELELDEHGSTARIEVPGGGSGRDHPFTLRLRVPGLHNVRNAAAALAVVYELGADIGRALAALAQFTGVGRRVERVGDAVRAGDVVFTLGAGDITRVGPELLARLGTGGTGRGTGT